MAEVQHITEEVSVEMKYNVWLKVEAGKSILALELNWPLKVVSDLEKKIINLLGIIISIIYIVSCIKQYIWQ